MKDKHKTGISLKCTTQYNCLGNMKNGRTNADDDSLHIGVNLQYSLRHILYNIISISVKVNFVLNAKCFE